MGLGTFRPVKVDDVENHHMHSEFYMIDEEAAEKVNRAKENGKCVICVGQRAAVPWNPRRTREGKAESLQRMDGDIHLSGIPVQDPGRTDHQFPSAGVHADHAGIRTGREGSCTCGL